MDKGILYTIITLLACGGLFFFVREILFAFGIKLPEIGKNDPNNPLPEKEKDKVIDADVTIDNTFPEHKDKEKESESVNLAEELRRKFGKKTIK